MNTKRCRWFAALSLLTMLPLSQGALRGQTWQLTSAPFTNWTSVACSADGNSMVAVVGGGLIYTSTNGGSAWKPTSAPVADWASVASSADGSILVVAPRAGRIHLSTNSGETWLGVGNWHSNNPAIACSADGIKMFYMPGPEISTNTGATWLGQATEPSGWWVACSADGYKVLSVAWQGPVFTSTNAGITWLDRGRVGGYSGASSADGCKLVTDAFGWIATSQDSGETWATYRSPDLSLLFLFAASGDGSRLLALGSTYWDAGPIFSSPDWGVTWTSNNAPRQHWSCAALSADGCRGVAAVPGGGIYTVQYTPAPLLHVTAHAKAIIVSWTVPSVPLVLQQTPSPTQPNWMDVDAQPNLNYTNLSHQVSLPAPAGSMFYRLVSR